MDRTIDTTSSSELGIGSSDDGIERKLGDIGGEPEDVHDRAHDARLRPRAGTDAGLTLDMLSEGLKSQGKPTPGPLPRGLLRPPRHRVPLSPDSPSASRSDPMILARMELRHPAALDARAPGQGRTAQLLG